MSILPDPFEFVHVVEIITNAEKGVTLKNLEHWLVSNGYIKKVDFRHVGTKSRIMNGIEEPFYSSVSLGKSYNPWSVQFIQFNRFRFKDSEVAIHFKMAWAGYS